MDDLRQRVAKGDYPVDPERIAGAMIKKIRLMQVARARLLADARGQARFERAR